MADTIRDKDETKEYFDDAKTLLEKVLKVAELVKKSKYMIAFTGAGISTSAGIPDFRSGLDTVLKTGAGKWELEAAKKKGINVENKQKKWSGKKRGGVIKAVPTPTHMMLVKLCKKGKLKHLISQNTDGLHRKSGFPIDCLSELHGNGNLEICGTCGKQYLRDYRVRNRTIGTSLQEKKRKINELKEPYARKKHWTGRYCTTMKCQIASKKDRTNNVGKLYDTIINFGENLPQHTLKTAEEETVKADLCISMGSSLTVTPAADMPMEVGQQQHVKGSELVIVNLQKTPLDEYSNLRIFGKTDEFTKLLMKALDIDIPQWELDRFINVKIKKHVRKDNDDNEIETRVVTIHGCDRDGTRYDIFKKCVLSVNGKEFAAECKSKSVKKSLGYIVYKVDKWGKNDIKLIMKFMSHYNEPDLTINLKDYLYSDIEQTIVLNMRYNCFKREWTVQNKKEQLNNKFIKCIYEKLKIEPVKSNHKKNNNNDSDKHEEKDEEKYDIDNDN